MSRRRTSKGTRWLEVILLVAGLTGVGIWVWSHVRMAVFQSWAKHALEQQANKRPSAFPPLHRVTPPPLAKGTLIGQLEIPRLKMRSVVREGADRNTLDVALGHIPGTALPGQSGNVAVAGHRDTLFRGLRNIKKDDIIDFETPGATYKYEVESTKIVKPDDVEVLHTTAQPEITLVTCYPFYYVGSAPDRFIVKAKLMNPGSVPPVVGVRPSSAIVRHKVPQSTVARLRHKSRFAVYAQRSALRNRNPLTVNPESY